MINSRVIFLMRVETKATVRVSENSAQAREKLVMVVNTGTNSSVHCFKSHVSLKCLSLLTMTASLVLYNIMISEIDKNVEMISLTVNFDRASASFWTASNIR